MLAIHSPSIISSGTANAVLSAYQISQQVHPSIFFPVKISIVPYHMICKRLYFIRGAAETCSGIASHDLC